MAAGPVGAIARLTQELGKLPGIGPKTAERLTHYLLAADRGRSAGPGRRPAGRRGNRFIRAGNAST